mgnify:CR=1 FL=1
MRLKVFAQIVDMTGDYSILTSDYGTAGDLAGQIADRLGITVFRL